MNPENFFEFFQQVEKDAQEIFFGPGSAEKLPPAPKLVKVTIVKPACQCNICRRDRRMTPDLDGYLKLGQGRN